MSTSNSYRITAFKNYSDSIRELVNDIVKPHRDNKIKPWG